MPPSLVLRMLYGASERGELKFIDLALSTGMDINTTEMLGSGRPSDGSTALIYATIEGQVDSVRFLLERGAASDARGPLGMTALMTAMAKGRTVIARLLLQHGADCRATEAAYGSTPLHVCALGGHASLAALLLTHDCGPGTPLVALRNAAGLTPLHEAAVNGKDYVASMLLRAGADVDARDGSGRTPLSFAAEYGFGVVVRILLNAGADANAADKSGRTPVAYASNAATRKLLLPRAKAAAADAAPATPAKDARGDDAVAADDSSPDGPATPPQEDMLAGGSATAAEGGGSSGKKRKVKKRNKAGKAAADGAESAPPSPPLAHDAPLAPTAAVTAGATAAAATQHCGGDAAAAPQLKPLALVDAIFAGATKKVAAASALLAAEAAAADRAEAARRRKALAAARLVADAAARTAEEEEAAAAAAEVDAVLEDAIGTLQAEHGVLRAALAQWCGARRALIAARAAAAERAATMAALERAYGSRLAALSSAAAALPAGCSAADCPLCPSRAATVRTRRGISWAPELSTELAPAAPQPALSYGFVHVLARPGGAVPCLSPLQAAIRRQVLYYFSADNLARDPNLRRQMESESGYVPVALLAAFHRVRFLTAETPSPALVMSALQGCRLLQLSADGAGVRCHDWCRWLLPPDDVVPPPAPALRGSAPPFVPHADSDSHAASAAAFTLYAAAYRDAACAALAAADVAMQSAASAPRRRAAVGAAVERAKAVLLSVCNTVEAERRWGDAAAAALRDAAAALHAAARRVRPVEDDAEAAWLRVPVAARGRGARGRDDRAGESGAAASPAASGSYTRASGVAVGARDAKLAVTPSGAVVATRPSDRSAVTVALLRDARR